MHHHHDDHDDLQETATATLFAIHYVDGWCVEDDLERTVWWPGADAQREIADSDHPAGTAVRICETQPSRGTWRKRGSLGRKLGGGNA